jgi:hypothetical protein
MVWSFPHVVLHWHSKSFRLWSILDVRLGIAQPASLGLAWICICEMKEPKHNYDLEL